MNIDRILTTITPLCVLLGLMHQTPSYGDELLAPGSMAREQFAVKTYAILQSDKADSQTFSSPGGILVCHLGQAWRETPSNLRCNYILSELTLEEHFALQNNQLFLTLKEVRNKKIIDQKTIQIKDLSPITWKTTINGGKALQIIIIPFLDDQEEQEVSFSTLPISSPSFLIIDSKERVWAHGVGGTGTLLEFSSPHGTIILSYYPFSQSRQLGTASGQEMNLKIQDGEALHLYSQTPLVPYGMKLKVFGLFVPEKRVQGFSISAPKGSLK